MIQSIKEIVENEIEKKIQRSIQKIKTIYQKLY